MNRKIVKRVVILLAVSGVEAAFGYAYLCGAMTVTYGLSLPSADLTQAEFEQVLYLSRLTWIPFVAFHVFLVVLYLSGRILDKNRTEQ
jgi:hypothetical protein